VAPEVNVGAQEAIIDRALQAWRQGDCTLEPQWFVHRINPSLTLTAAGSAAAREGAELAEQQVNGLVVVSQTCDIVRACQERPYLEVCPLVRVSDEALHQIERGRKPAYAYLPQLADRRFVADLDRTMTVEKALVLSWSRTPGCASDTEVGLSHRPLHASALDSLFPTISISGRESSRAALLTSTTGTPQKVGHSALYERSEFRQAHTGKVVPPSSCSSSFVMMMTLTSKASLGKTFSTHG